MKEAFEKIIDELKQESIIVDDDAGHRAVEIIHQIAEEYNNGWIPCSERLPSGLDFVLYTHKDGEVDICSIEYFYDYLDKFTAWQPLPEPYQPKGE